MNKLVQLKRVTDGAWGGAISRRKLCESEGEAPAAGRFFVRFGEKMAILMHLDHISHVSRSIWKNKIFEIWKPIEQISPFTSGQVQSTIKILHFGVKFCDLAWSGESRYIAFWNIFSIKSFTRRFASENFFCHENNHFWEYVQPGA